MKIKLFTAVMLSVISISAEAGQKNSSELEVVPYAWFSGFRGNLTVEGQSADVVRKSDELFENLDIGGSLEITARNKEMVIYGAIDYFDLISSDVKVGNQTGELETTELIGLIALGYPLASGPGKNIDLLMGLQTLRVENDLKLSGGGSWGSSTHIYDPLIMLRIKHALSDKLFINIPLAIGGYLGDSDFMYQAGIQLGLQFTDNFDLRAGYRIVGYDFEKNDFNSLDFYQQGWTLGLGILF